LCCFSVCEPVAPLAELPLLWSLMLEPVLPLWLLVPVAPLVVLPLCPAVLLDCACTLIALNIAAATDAPSRPFSNLFVFMSIS
jgi:signal-induced proliferation-associated 1 like protein 3